jgi:hypothetical protein
MSRLRLPDHAKRVQLSITLSPTTLSILDAYVKEGWAETRSRGIEAAILLLRTMNPAEKRRK